MKKVFALILCLALVMSMAGCVRIVIDGEESSVQVSANGTIGLSVSTQNNPFFVTLYEGAQAEADKLGVTLKMADAGDDTAKQAACQIGKRLHKRKRIPTVRKNKRDNTDGQQDRNSAGEEIFFINVCQLFHERDQYHPATGSKQTVQCTGSHTRNNNSNTMSHKNNLLWKMFPQEAFFIQNITDPG